MEWFEHLKRWILNTLFPPHCASCNQEGDFLCAQCIGNLKKRKIKAHYKKSECSSEFEHLDGLIYALNYAQNPQIQAAIKQFKYGFNKDLAMYFGQLIKEKMEQLGMIKNKKIHFIPVPLHKKRLNYRGFNQAQVIAQQLVKSPGRTQITPLIERIRHTDQQAKLSKKKRHENLKNAFIVNKKIVQENEVYFLVDDVCTTGATLENCAKALKQAGLKKVYGLVVARAFK